MSDTYNYEVLEPGGHARLVGNVLDRISRASANPASAVGSSRAMLGDTETASWTERTTAADGAALIEAVYGNTIVQDGSLLPVRMEGVETVGFNQWDEEWELGTLDADGQPVSGSSIRSKNFIPVLPSTAYYIAGLTSGELRPYYYDGAKAFVSRDYWTGGTANNPFTIPSTARYMKFAMASSYGSTYKHDICINFSDPSRNGEYEPHWSSQCTIPVSTYFPQGMRSAGTVRDELRADAAVTRVGAVDLGTLTWTYQPAGYFYADISSPLPSLALVFDALTCDRYETSTVNNATNMPDKTIKGSSTQSTVFVKDSAYTDAATLKTAMSGVMLHYALATPVTTPIDPPLPLSYRTGAGGTERVMVASGTTSAPPIFATRYPLDPADLAASIAPRESAVATGNHAVGDLIMLGWTLCKVTTSIARGEAITIGTNVTQTSVAAEIAALS